MRSPLLERDPLLAQLEQLIADKFQFSAIEMNGVTPDKPLLGGPLGFDDLDTLELATYVEEQFGVRMDETAESRAALSTIASLADFIRRHASESRAADPIGYPRSSPEWTSRSAGDPSDRLRFSAGIVQL